MMKRKRISFNIKEKRVDAGHYSTLWEHLTVVNELSYSNTAGDQRHLKRIQWTNKYTEKLDRMKDVGVISVDRLTSVRFSLIPFPLSSIVVQLIIMRLLRRIKLKKEWVNFSSWLESFISFWIEEESIARILGKTNKLIEMKKRQEDRKRNGDGDENEMTEWKNGLSFLSAFLFWRVRDARLISVSSQDAILVTLFDYFLFRSSVNLVR